MGEVRGRGVGIWGDMGGAKAGRQEFGGGGSHMELSRGGDKTSVALMALQGPPHTPRPGGGGALTGIGGPSECPSGAGGPGGFPRSLGGVHHGAGGRLGGATTVLGVCPGVGGLFQYWGFQHGVGGVHLGGCHGVGGPLGGRGRHWGGVPHSVGGSVRCWGSIRGSVRCWGSIRHWSFQHSVGGASGGPSRCQGSIRCWGDTHGIGGGSIRYWGGPSRC